MPERKGSGAGDDRTALSPTEPYDWKCIVFGCRCFCNILLTVKGVRH